MQRGHAPAVEEMLARALPTLDHPSGFTAIDAGCGNGWVVRILDAVPRCTHAIGIDGARGMIEKARRLDPKGTYLLDDLSSWDPTEPVDLVHSMEVLYYLEDPSAFLERLVSTWLRPGGRSSSGSTTMWRTRIATIGRRPWGRGCSCGRSRNGWR